MVQFPIQSLSKKVPHMVIFLQTRIGSLIKKGGSKGLGLKLMWVLKGISRFGGEKHNLKKRRAQTQ